MQKRNESRFPVSIVVAMRNAESTVLLALESLEKQKYPITEILVIDNASTDRSVDVVKKHQMVVHKIKIKLICRKVNQGVGASYNLGVHFAKSNYVVFLHADSYLSSSNELSLLTKPFREQAGVAATCPYIDLPENIWLAYPFWEKCLLARSVGRSSPGFNGKFDCIDKKAFLSIGGFDTIHYGHNIGVGSEDMDLALRLQKIGKVVGSNAVVVHLHSLNNKYSFKEWIENRKLLARSYGRLIRIQGRHLFPGGLVFTLKPLLAFVVILPMFLPWNAYLLLGFALIYMGKMYTSRSAISDPKILLLPGITILLVFYETFWMIESFLYLTKKRV